MSETKCKYDEMVEVTRLRPNPRNPAVHDQEQVERLAMLIKNHGWRHPVIVSNQSGLIVAGHCRLMSAMHLGEIEVPVEYQDYQNDAEELAVMLADNFVADMSSYEGLKVADALVELDQLNYPVALTGLDKAQIDSYVLGPTGEDEFSLPDGDRDGFQQMTFILSDAQAETVKEAIKKSKAFGCFQDTGNENSNGNALERICESFNG